MNPLRVLDAWRADLQLAAADASTSLLSVARQDLKEEKKGCDESRHTEVRLWLRELAVLNSF